MPLRVTRRKDTGTLWIVGTVRAAGAPQGVRVRRRAGTDDPRLAQEEASGIEREILRGHHLGERPRSRSFAEAVASYLDHEPRSPQTHAFLARLLIHFREIPLDRIGQEQVDRARSIVLRHGAAPATVKRNLIAPLRAVLRHAERRGWCRSPSFDLPREPKGRTSFLLPDQAARLVRHGGKLAPLILFLICSGCRAGEAIGLQWDDVDLRGARAILHEGDTKAGRRRVVALPPALWRRWAPFRPGRAMCSPAATEKLTRPPAASGDGGARRWPRPPCRPISPRTSCVTHGPAITTP
jgi:integrase